MDSGNLKASDLERRLSRRSSVRVSVHGGEEEGFDFTAGAISDGFRPPEPSSSTVEPETPALETVSPDSANPVENNSPSLQTRPSSIAKHSRAGDSFSLRHDGGMGAIQEAAASRSSSVTTDTEPYIATESPYHGPSNPSHPYQMYPQNVRVARTLSGTTTSTAPAPESPYSGPGGPAHPYSMYPQATVNESSPAPATVIPVGFPGIADPYQRRIGPEGEDVGDIIGPDGHTEQLPPYTRYPDEPFAAKVAVAGPSTAAPAPTAAAPAPLAVPETIPGAGGIGLATRDPEFESIDDLDSPRSRDSCRSFTTEASNRAINETATGISEKQRPERGSLWGRRRLGGIVPYWAICLTILALLMMGAVLGSVMGTFMAKHKKPPQHGGNNNNNEHPLPSVTITYDATPIPTPSDLPPLVTGTFGMPLMSSRVSSVCFNDSQLSQAWNCNILMFAGLTMTIGENQVTPELVDYTISLTCNESFTLSSHVYSYGEQPPLIPLPLALELVNDTLEPGRGPAWFKMVPYNKTIILPEPVLEPPNGPAASTQPRSFTAFGGGPGDLKRKGTAQSGDRPWICTWPETLLEIFIYPMQNSSWNRPPPTGAFPAGPFPTEMASMGSSTIPGAPAPTGENPYHGDGGDGGAGGGEGPFIPPASAQGDYSTATTDIPPLDTSHFDFPLPLPPYPKVVKLEERRTAGSPTATCRQVEIVADDQPARPVKDANGNDVVIYIIENSPTPQTESSKIAVDNGYRHNGNPLLHRDSSSDLSDCGCMWFIT